MKFGSSNAFSFIATTLTPSLPHSASRHEPDIDQHSEQAKDALAQSNRLIAITSFKPPNPCNPFDPPIVSALLTRFSSERDFYDLRQDESQLLEQLQKFAKKKARRASGNSNSSRGGFEDSDLMEIAIADRKFGVIDKLGEGGFGAVFQAVDMNLRRNSDSDPDGEDDDGDDGDEDKGKVALKVVKPAATYIIKDQRCCRAHRICKGIVNPMLYKLNLNMYEDC